MKYRNRPVTSREYKLMLAVDRFSDRDRGCQQFWHLLEFFLHRQGANIVEKQNTDSDEERRRTWYLDTSEFALRRRGYVLRVREEMDEDKKYKITLKYRGGDRYLSAIQNLYSPEADKFKFEEDILPPFTSKFSHSTSVQKKKQPDLDKIKHIEKLFPGIETLDIPSKTPISKVNDFEAREVFRKVAKVNFGEDAIVYAGLSFWYLLGTEDEIPLVGEFSFDYYLPDKDNLDDGALEAFPPRVVAGANQLFTTLQNQPGWLDLGGTTKTAFAYDGFL